MVAAIAPLGGTLPATISQTSYTYALPLMPAALAQTQPSPADLIHVEIGGLRNNKGHVVRDLYSSANGFPKNGASLGPRQAPDPQRTCRLGLSGR